MKTKTPDNKTFNMPLRASVPLEHFSLSVGSLIDYAVGPMVIVNEIKNITSKLYDMLVDLTPYKEGYAKGGWQIIIRGNAVEYNPLRPGPEDGEAVKAEELKKLESLILPGVVHITNDLLYIGLLERGYSNQAPQGFLDIAILRLQEGNNAVS